MQAAQERERLLALHKEAELARAKLESELTLAARIQADLFPRDAAAGSTATSWRRGTAPRGAAAATTTTRCRCRGAAASAAAAVRRGRVAARGCRPRW